jgi:hypothetical protein
LTRGIPLDDWPVLERAQYAGTITRACWLAQYVTYRRNADIGTRLFWEPWPPGVHAAVSVPVHSGRKWNAQAVRFEAMLWVWQTAICGNTSLIYCQPQQNLLCSSVGSAVRMLLCYQTESLRPLCSTAGHVLATC